MATIGTITSQGVGSNLDIAGIVSQLMDIERIPLNRLVDKQTAVEAKISALGSIKGFLSSFQTSLSGLTSGSSFQASKATSSNTSIIKATGTSGAVSGNYSIEVSQLAQSQKLVAAGQADTTTAIGVGTLTIDLGTISGGTFDDISGTYSGASFTPNATGSVDIVIDSSNNSLAGIRDAINAANIGVSASIVNDGDAANPYRLVLSSKNGGTDESVRIAVSGDASLSTLLSHDPAGTQNLSETVTGQNAILEVDGIPVTKTSNTVTDVIQGVSLELSGLTAGTPVTVSTSQDSDAAKTAVEAFIKAYNDLTAEIKKQTSPGVSGTGAGALESDSATRQIQSFIRTELNTAPTGLTGTTYATLSSIGISFESDGTLSLDEEKLNTAIQTDNNNVTELFSSADGYATRLDSLVSGMLGYDGTIATRTDAFEQRINSLEDQQVTMESRLSRTEARLRARFTALDVLIATMSVTSEYLTNQIKALNANSSN